MSKSKICSKIKFSFKLGEELLGSIWKMEPNNIFKKDVKGLNLLK